MQQLRARDLGQAGDRVAVAVSGGADSIALLHLLLELRGRLGIIVGVAHFNHQLRGGFADADEKFVARLAAKYGLDFHVARADVAARAKRDKSNLEDTARRERYAFFERLISAGHATKIAVAHTADDQAETVLAHILRGTGLAGLGGIHPVAGYIVRPLLPARRADLRAYNRRLLEYAGQGGTVIVQYNKFEFNQAYPCVRPGGLLLSDDVTFNSAFDESVRSFRPTAARVISGVGIMKK